MKILSMSMGVATAVWLLVAGCATSTAPYRGSASDASHSASPKTRTPNGFPGPDDIFGQYPELELQTR